MPGLAEPALFFLSEKTAFVGKAQRAALAHVDVNKYVFLYSLPVSIFRDIVLLLDRKPIARLAAP